MRLSNELKLMCVLIRFEMTALFVLKIIIEHINLNAYQVNVNANAKANGKANESDKERKNGGANQSKSGRKEGKEQESGEFYRKECEKPKRMAGGMSAKSTCIRLMISFVMYVTTHFWHYEISNIN